MESGPARRLERVRQPSRQDEEPVGRVAGVFRDDRHTGCGGITRSTARSASTTIEFRCNPGWRSLPCSSPSRTIVSWVKTGARISTAQRAAGSRFRCSGLIGSLLAVLGFGIVCYQSQLNKVWDLYGNPAPGTPIG